MKSLQLTIVAALALAVTSAGVGNNDLPRRESGSRHYDDQVRPFLARHCLECHGAVRPKGGLRLDEVSSDFAHAADRDKWLAVLKRVKADEMPPKGKPRLPEKERQALCDWIDSRTASTWPSTR